MSTIFILMNFIVISVLAEDPTKSNQVNNVNPDGSYQFSWVIISETFESSLSPHKEYLFEISSYTRRTIRCKKISFLEISHSNVF